MSETLWLRCVAPFAAFRWLQAGVYRATSPIVPPSAARGLVLNLAGIETRGPLDETVTGVRDDAPALLLAIGGTVAPQIGRLYQQLHSYPVGNSGATDLKPRTRGAKYWIAPVRREVLVGFECILGVRGPPEVHDRVVRGLAGELSAARYGLPFAGDNNFLFDRIDLLPRPPAVRWYLPIDAEVSPTSGSCRLTVGIDRRDSSRTTTRVFAPVAHPVANPPPDAWIWTPRMPVGA